mgnify:CR=1 FL=1
MWTKIAGIILRNRIAFIAGVLLGTIFMGFQARKIQMSYESADLLPKTDSAYLDYTRFRETFGQEGNVMVFAIQDSGFYQLNKTNDWIQMGNDIKALQGVNALMSITHTFNLQKNTDLKKFEVLPIFPSHIETQAELDSLAYVAAKKCFVGCTGISPDIGMVTEMMSEVNLNQMMFQRVTGTTYILADSSKFGVRTGGVSCPPEKIENIITDVNAPAQMVCEFREMGTWVYQVD